MNFNYTTLQAVAATVITTGPLAGYYGDEYIADMHMIDGQQLTPSSFGETDANGYWRPKAYTGTYGTNGFHLDFENGSDLGNDVSGNNNDWTVNNLNATDWVVDTPTNAYATGNPLVVPAGGTFSNGNLQNSGAATSTFLITSGKWYWEVYANGSGVSAGVRKENGATGSTTPIASGATAGFLYDADNGVLYATTNNGASFNASSTVAGPAFVFVTGGSTIINYGQSKNATSTATTLTYRSDSGGYFLYQPTTQTTSGSGSQNFTSSGTFTVPSYATLTVTLWGAGGGGAGAFMGGPGGSYMNGRAGGSSSFGSVTAGGGGGGVSGSYPYPGGSGGTASGGDTNTSGTSGQGSGYGSGGAAASPGGGSGGAQGGGTYFTSSCGGGYVGGGGSVPGGGGGGSAFGTWPLDEYGGCATYGYQSYVGPGGGGGARAQKTYAAGDLTVNSPISVTVGTGGSGGDGGYGYGGNGARGEVRITWTTSSSSAAPSDYKALSTANLPEPAIVIPKNYFDAVLYTGNASTNAITGLGFQPNLVWIKNRTDAASHALFDAVRGVQKFLSSNSTAAEDTDDTQSLSSFDSTGFSLGTGGSTANVNTASKNYVAWLWKESTTSGFDIVTYTGNGSNRTVAHSLGVAPSMIIVKNRDNANNWNIFHSANTAAPETDYLQFTTAATADLDTMWNDTAPNASVFSLGTSAGVNTNAQNYIAYLFAEVPGFSKFGSYTGNGSTDGPFVYTGFKPKFLMWKNTGAATDWQMVDAARDTYDPRTLGLYPDSSGAESAWGAVDFLSNGFKIRSTVTSQNGANTIIYAAFAEQPFKYSAAPAELAAGINAGTTFLMGMEI